MGGSQDQLFSIPGLIELVLNLNSPQLAAGRVHIIGYYSEGISMKMNSKRLEISKKMVSSKSIVIFMILGAILFSAYYLCLLVSTKKAITIKELLFGLLTLLEVELFLVLTMLFVRFLLKYLQKNDRRN